MLYLVVEDYEKKKRKNSCCCERVKHLEEEDELEVLRDHLERGTDWGDGDELGDVEDEGEADHRDDMVKDDHSKAVSSAFLL